MFHLHAASFYSSVNIDSFPGVICVKIGTTGSALVSMFLHPTMFNGSARAVQRTKSLSGNIRKTKNEKNESKKEKC